MSKLEATRVMFCTKCGKIGPHSFIKKKAYLDDLDIPSITYHCLQCDKQNGWEGGEKSCINYKHSCPSLDLTEEKCNANCVCYEWDKTTTPSSRQVDNLSLEA